MWCVPLEEVREEEVVAWDRQQGEQLFYWLEAKIEEASNLLWGGRARPVNIPNYGFTSAGSGGASLPESSHCSYVEIIGFVAIQGTDDSSVNKLHPVLPSSKMIKQTDCRFSREWMPGLWSVIIQGQLFNILTIQKLLW